MSFGYKVSEISKSLSMTNKKFLEILEDFEIKVDKKHNTVLDENTVNFILERLTIDNMTQSLDSFLVKETKNNKLKNIKSKKVNINKREETTTVKLSNLSDDDSIKIASENEHNKKNVRHVDTRSTYVDLDKYNDRYENIAPSNKIDGDNIQKKQKLTQKSQQKFKNKKSNKNKISESEKLLRIAEMNKKKKTLEITVGEEIIVSNLASLLKVTATEVIKKLMSLGVMATVTQSVDYDTAEVIAHEFGAKIKKEQVVTIEERVIDDVIDDDKDLEDRSPVVVIMGHVDHGKTSLLDTIRKKNVTSTEAGGITQHIGAYKVSCNGKNITFLDTPGHEAFTSMRARGASITDIAILVVAADDGIMPQTVEAINHAKAAGVSMIVAINKIDKPNANIEKIKQELTEYELVPEDWGGDVICVGVSAKTSENIDQLLEMILLVAEVKELKANPNRPCKGVVIEAKLDKRRGPVATVLVQNGTLRTANSVIAGSCMGKIRVMSDENGKTLTEAGPSTPVEITGLNDVPEAGDELNVVKNEKLARMLVEERKFNAKQEQFNSYKKVTLETLFSKINEGDMKELSVIVKADVQGSCEAVKQSLEKIENEEVRVKVIHSAVGAVTESDIMLSEASGALVIAFNVDCDQNAKLIAQKKDIEIRFYNIIYDAIEDIKSAIKGMLTPKFREVEIGQAEVRMIYKISSVGTISGSYVTLGKITRNAKVKLLREGEIICEDTITSLKRFKDDVKEVQKGFECGISLEKFDDIKEGDIFQVFELQEYID